MRIKVVDDICGSGKTSWAIQKINEAKNDEKFIYVTPYLNEVDRIINSTTAEFLEPETTKGHTSKLNHFKELLKTNNSIVTTHQLFKMLDDESQEMIKSNGYTLIMDEVANVLNQATISSKEIDYLLKAEAIEVKEDGTVVWIDEKYGEDEEDKRFRDIKILAKNENLFIYEKSAIFWTMNINSFLSFKDVYILTYLFDGQIQKYYYDFYDVEYEKYSVNKIENGYDIVPYNKYKEPRKEIYDKLLIYEDYKIGRISSNLNTNYYTKYGNTVLSSRWFKNASSDQIKQLKNNLRNYFANLAKVENKHSFWTTKKDFAPILKNPKCTFNKKDDRSKDNFVSMNARATNAYGDRTAMAYVYNRFMNPMEKRFFQSKGIEVNENVLAMSDLIQFVFRGCIRNGEPMNCYIPAERMRNLLKDWSEFKD